MTYIYFLEAMAGAIGPFLLGWLLIRKYRLSWRPFLIGGATFIISQAAHLPMLYGYNRLFHTQSLESLLVKGDPSMLLLHSFFIGLMAGLCEEVARFLVYRHWLREYGWEKGVLFGAGHGGTECFLLLGIFGFATLVQMISLHNADLSAVAGVSPDQIPALQAHVQAFWSQPWWIPLTALLERALAIIFHIAMALMIMQGILKRRIFYLVGAIAAHTLLDMGAVFIMVQKKSVWMIEGFTAICAAFAFAYIIYLKKRTSHSGPGEAAPVADNGALDASLVIDSKGLTKSFDGQVAVEGISFQVRPGEIFGFLGPNGAGKTTTVRMLCALIGHTAGAAMLNGHLLGRDDEDIRRSTGILTETPGLYPRLSAYKNLEFFARLYGVSDIEGQIKKYLTMLGLWERRDDLAGEFSKGMAQKLAIARALLHEPAVIFLDEPTSALDPESAAVVRDFIEELKSHGRTIFLCTHNLDEADRLCDRIAIIKKRIISLDTPESLRQKLYGTSVSIHMREVPPGLEATIASLPFVRTVTAKEHELVVELDAPEENNPRLVRLIVESGGDIRYVEKVSHSLEEVYFSLMKKAE